ncbi:MAG TPA: hypothetical protein VEW93_13660 [Acidimicrobiales bacterium]|nr:hypothetical protein [Acidimicrobiales bacterium]
MALALVAPAAGCSGGGPERPSGGCDDRVEPSVAVPGALRARLAAHDITSVVGEGMVWFIAPASATWSEVVQSEGGRRSAKLPLWVDRDGPLPTFTVRLADGSGPRGSMSAHPTADGLPGPVPATATFPEAGCWAVEASVDGDVARITVDAR